MRELFRPYEGRKPYFFVSYSHCDSAFVLDTISPMREQCFRLWYDEGIPAGSDWPVNIADHLKGCSAVLFFRSATALASPNCFNEIKNAHEQGKRIYCICLDGVEPEGDWVECLADALYLDLGGLSAAALSAVFLGREEVRELFAGTEEDYRSAGRKGEKIPLLYSLMAAASILLLLLGAGVFAKRHILSAEAPVSAAPVETPQAPIDLELYGAMWQQYIDFPDAQQKNAVQNVLGCYGDRIESERLADISALYFCGNMSSKNGPAAVEHNGSDGWMLNGVPVREGSIRDLSLIAQMPYLEELALVYQLVEDLSALENMPRLRELSLAGCPNVRLDTLRALPSLETLRLEHSAVEDLTVLQTLPALRTVTVSADMFPMKFDPHAGYDVILVR